MAAAAAVVVVAAAVVAEVSWQLVVVEVMVVGRVNVHDVDDDDHCHSLHCYPYVEQPKQQDNEEPKLSYFQGWSFFLMEVGDDDDHHVEDDVVMM